jgi:hypothetical protein
MKLPINHRDSWSLLPNGKPKIIKAPAMASKQDYENMGSNFSDVKPKNEPQPNAFSAETFPQTTKNDYKSDTVFIN